MWGCENGLGGVEEEPESDARFGNWNKGLRTERGPSNKGPIDIRLREQIASIIGFYTATVKDPGAGCEIIARCTC